MSCLSEKVDGGIFGLRVLKHTFTHISVFEFSSIVNTRNFNLSLRLIMVVIDIVGQQQRF